MRLAALYDIDLVPWSCGLHTSNLNVREPVKKPILITVLVVLAIPVAMIGACQYIENPKTNYNSMVEVQADGAVMRGWVPLFIPKEATEITEQHNIDKNTGFISFKLPDRGLIVNGNSPCKPIDYIEVKWFDSYPIWWPSELQGSSPESSKLPYYYCDSGIVGTEYEGRQYIWLPGA